MINRFDNISFDYTHDKHDQYGVIYCKLSGLYVIIVLHASRLVPNMG